MKRMIELFISLLFVLIYGSVIAKRCYTFEKDSLSGVLIELSDPNLSLNDIELLNDALEKEDYLKMGSSENWNSAVQKAQEFQTKHGMKTMIFAGYHIQTMMKNAKQFINKFLSDRIKTKFGINQPALILKVSNSAEKGLIVDTEILWNGSTLQTKMNNSPYELYLNQINDEVTESANVFYQQSGHTASTTAEKTILFQSSMMDFWQGILDEPDITGADQDDILIWVNGRWSSGGNPPCPGKPYWYFDDLWAFGDASKIAKQVAISKNFLTKSLEYFKTKRSRMVFLDGGEYEVNSNGANRQGHGRSMGWFQKAQGFDGNAYHDKFITDGKTLSKKRVGSDAANFKEYLEKVYGTITPNSKIHIITHSMGGAYGEGLIEVLKSSGLTIGKILHLAPADVDDIKTAISGVEDRTIMFGSQDKTINLKSGFESRYTPMPNTNTFIGFIETQDVRNIPNQNEIDKGWKIEHALNIRSVIWYILDAVSQLQVSNAIAGNYNNLSLHELLKNQYLIPFYALKLKTQSNILLMPCPYVDDEVEKCIYNGKYFFKP
jgi:hypothetical protein